jgi:PPK2 family polyphosphate:nucleotide phosphotransferase
MAKSNRNYAALVDGSKRIDLDDYDPGDSAGLEKEAGEAELEALGTELSELEDLLFYAGTHSLLIVLQGPDTSGKDGMIRKILDFCNAQSFRVEPFKVPTSEELAHDILWRIHQKAPGRGSITIFNRSHYEDVLVVRVHKYVEEHVWKKRYEHINHFESLLADSDTIIVKFYLHLSKGEQEERLLAREEETEKAWKLSAGDWKERELWNDYRRAYEDILNKCSKPHAPWFIVPADHKWFRNLAVVQQLVAALRPYRERWLESLRETGEKAKADIAAFRGGSPPEK